MLVLAIDTSSQVGSLAALRGTELVGVVSSDSQETHSTRLFRQLKSLLAAHRLAMEAFDLYAVAAGPGSFTGVRVGLTAVKGWAEVYGKPVVPVSVLEAVAAQALESAPLVAAVIDARRGQLYVGLFETAAGERRHRGEDVVMPPQECFNYLKDQACGEGICFITPTPGWLTALLAHSAFRGSRIEEASPVLAPAIGRIGLERARRGEVLDAARLDAHYVRRSDAELLWKAQ